MNGLLKSLLALAVVSTFTACGGGGGGGSKSAVAPNACLNYVYNHQTNGYMTPNNTPVNCDPSQVGYNNFNNFAPYNNYYNGGMVTGCDIYTRMYGVKYVATQVGPGQMVCVNTGYYTNISGFNTMYTYYGYYPQYTCQWGVNCNSRCIGGTAGANAGVAWIGGTLGLCW